METNTISCRTAEISGQDPSAINLVSARLKSALSRLDSLLEMPQDRGKHAFDLSLMAPRSQGIPYLALAEIRSKMLRKRASF